MTEQVPFWWVVVALFVPPLLSFAGVVVAQRWQDRREHKQWLRDQRISACREAIEYATVLRMEIEQFDGVKFARIESQLKALGLWDMSDNFARAISVRNSKDPAERIAPMHDLVLGMSGSLDIDIHNESLLRAALQREVRSNRKLLKEFSKTSTPKDKTPDQSNKDQPGADEGTNS